VRTTLRRRSLGAQVLIWRATSSINAAMSPDEIESKVKEIICNQLEVSPEQLRPEASFIDDLKADSLAVVELVLAFEQEFKITIPEEDTEQIKTVKDATNYIKTHAK
jgi:acyl carrier protein